MRVLIRSAYVTCVILRNRDCSMETKRKVTNGHVICSHPCAFGLCFHKEIYRYLYIAITRQKNRMEDSGLNAKVNLNLGMALLVIQAMGMTACILCFNQNHIIIHS